MTQLDHFKNQPGGCCELVRLGPQWGMRMHGSTSGKSPPKKCALARNLEAYGLRLMSLVFSLERFPEAEADRGGKEHDSTYSR